MPMITNDAEWNAIIPMLIHNAVNDVVDQALELLKQYVQDIVYTYTPKSDIYDRSPEAFSFLNAWERVSTTITNKVMSVEFGYQPKSMSVNPDIWRHGSNFWSGGTDARDVLADIIFKGLSAESSVFGEIPARDAWTPFKAEFDAKWLGWWRTALAKQGLI